MIEDKSLFFYGCTRVSMLIDTINNRKSKNETESTVLGPFHAEAPDISLGDNIANHVEGERCIVKGK